MRMPSRAKARAIARPMPRPPPVINAILFLSMSVAGESGFAFFEKGLDAFVTVVRIEATQLCFGFVAQHLFELGRLAHVHRMFCCRERYRGRGAQAFGELQCGCF